MRSTKSLADAIGLPDEEDKKRIQLYLLRYEKKHPGELLFHRDAARVRLQDPEFGVIDATAARRYLFELPEEIGKFLSEAYPLMFKDKKHTAWFAKNFQELLIPRKY